ncbi:DUF3168 domain-containing protein [Ralstonia solanacearum P673]|uniref:DUF3168 domain-containing protein n=1 Tax=Ralstonia solanacearum TaxID=305 RepID=UPI002029CDF4|nr:DUF3168 domain-containing protein [Ralstonia solanacearum]MCL9849869.1 DUF3168 domain-containing protein [Ralstonia solanacearum]MCL9856419.1 DUF3168 domain-containing protein [Ralstonia solanacearum]MCL9861185.1 DUF3168 domain-containing protein [Ralstonia solanacearum]MCL9866095.1 DUF3168 domain-containing protein [Ralstonia solanacearum]MCL9870823.1 DUF3168 domain-containing protein [Ralstonia solanacearum]
MTVEADIRRVVAPFVDDRVFPDEAPLDTPLPYVTYQQIGGLPFTFLDGLPDKRNGRFQFNLWAATRDEASGLMRAIADAVELDPVLQATPLGELAGTVEPITKLRGAQQDFSIWFAR